MISSLRFAALAAGMLAALAVVPAALGQPAAVATPSVMMYTGRYLANPELQKELKLTADQVKKIEPLTEGGPAQFLEAMRDPKKRDELNKSHAKVLAEALKPEQRKRLKEIVYQQLARIPVGARVLSADEEVVKQLKLTDAQKKDLQLRTPFLTVLTEQQKKVWDGMVGKPFDLQLALSFGRTTTTRTTAPPVLQYLEQKPVEAELNLTAEQRTQVAGLIAKWQKAFPTTRVTSVSQKKAQELSDELTKSARGLLTAAQAKRLDQIILQQSLIGLHETAVYTLPQVVAALKLSDEQKRSIEAINKERLQSLLPLFLSGEEAAQIVIAARAHKEETGKQLKQVLTAEQRTLLTDLIGAPFNVRLRIRAGFVVGPGGLAGPGGFAGPGGRGSRITTPLYTVIRGLLYAGSPDLHKELKLEEGQVKKLLAFQTKTRGETLGLAIGAGTDLEKKRKEQAQAVEKELGTILKPEQLARFKQVILQQHEQLASRGSLLLGRIVEVQEGLALTEAQKKRLQSGETLAKVIDAKQQAKWKEMLGKPFTGQLSIGGPATGLGVFARSVPLPPGLELLLEKSVQEELKLSAGQQKSLAEQEKKYTDSYPTRNRPVAAQQWRAILQKYRDDAEAAAAKVLNEKQTRRLKQIALQQTARTGLAMLLTTPAVVEGLALTARQTKVLDSLDDEENQISNLVFRELPRERRNDDDRTRTLAALTRVIDKKRNEALTGAQQQKLAELLGPAFQGKLERSRRGRGFSSF